MCGIVGFVNFEHRADAKIIEQMTESLTHRGPDDVGHFFSIEQQASIALGHRRLSILDLSSRGNQPMKFENLLMVYNGEIYNFDEIRLELETIGYVLKSNTDTEVVLKAYHAWGAGAIKRFNGMFSIAILDIEKNELVLIRDRAGVKPLYWYQAEGTFIFGSELKSFHHHPNFKKELCLDSVSLFLQFGYIPQPHSIFKNTYKLEAGHWLSINISSGEVKKQKYWDVNEFYNMPKHEVSDYDAELEVENILKSACNYRLVSDVPVGVFLSGGYDSSLVAALLQSERMEKIKTFSIGFSQKEFNEAHHAKRVAEHLSTDHTELYCTDNDALEIFPKIPEIWDEPFGDPSVIPTLLVSKLARNSVKVALSADGGDEIFGGYDRYQQTVKIERYFSNVPFKKEIAALMGAVDPSKIPFLNKIEKFDNRYQKIYHALKSSNPVEMLSLISSVFTPREISKVLKAETMQLTTHFNNNANFNNDLQTLDKLLATDYKTFQLDDVLVKVDRATMSVGLEGREPLLDYRLIEYVARLDPELKINGTEKKFLLKNITHKYIPKEIMARPKMGFAAPISKWLRTGLKDYLIHYLNKDRLEKGGIFDVNTVIRLRDRFIAGHEVNVNQLWLVLIFELWREKWMSV